MAVQKFKQNDNNFAIAYYRFSSHSQNEASIDQQREQAHAWADAHGYKIIREYEDAAMSGTRSDRPQYQLMLSEVKKLRPAVVILWKTDRLGRDRYELADAKRTLRMAGCKPCYVAEPTPDESPESALMETVMDGLAEFYSRQLSVNIQRGMAYNAEHALYNGHKVFGYTVDDEKHYIPDPKTAPFVKRMFDEYAAGKPMHEICDEFNEAGVRTVRGFSFNVKTMAKMLKNRRYIGEYQESGVTVDGGMPVLVEEATFEAAQARLLLNKRPGSRKEALVDEAGAPRYWLTGKLFCGECGESMQGVSGTSKTGAKHYYYYCKNQRRKQCTKKPVRKEWIEALVTEVLVSLLNDSENLASLAVDAAAHYKKTYVDTHYLDALEAQRRDVEKGLANFVKAVEIGIFNESTQKRMAELEQRRRDLTEAIEAEHVRASLFEDEHSIQAYFNKYLHADFGNPETRDAILEYFVDKIYVYDDRLVIASWYSEDNREIPFDILDGDSDLSGGSGFDELRLGSTKSVGAEPHNRARRFLYSWVAASRAAT